MNKPADLVLEQKKILEQKIIDACNQFMGDTGLALTGIVVEFSCIARMEGWVAETAINKVKISFTV